MADDTPETIEEMDPDRLEAELLMGLGGEPRTTDLDLISTYLPDEDDWAAKSILTRRDLLYIARLEMLPKLYPELEHLEPQVDHLVTLYLKSVTSLAGTSRREFLDIFRGLSGYSTSGDDAHSILKEALRPRRFDDD